MNIILEYIYNNTKGIDYELWTVVAFSISLCSLLFLSYLYIGRKEIRIKIGDIKCDTFIMLSGFTSIILFFLSYSFKILSLI